MSIEKALETLTTAVQENTAVQNEILAVLKAGKSKKAETDAQPVQDEETPRSTRRRAAADDTGETEPRRSRRAEKAEEAPAEEEPRRRRRASEDDDAPRATRRAAKEEKKKALKLDDVKAKFAAFLDVEDEKEEDERRDFIEAILDHLDLERTSDMDEKDFERVVQWIDDKEAGEDVRFD